MENETNNTTQQTTQDTADLLKVIEDMQNSMVSKEQYEALQADNRKLVQSIANGARVSSTTNEDTAVSIEELVRQMRGEGELLPDIKNLDFIQNALKYHDAVMDKYGIDVFLPNGHTYVPTEADAASAKRLYDVLSECVELANGDSTIFTAQLQSRMVDTPPIKRK